MAAAAAAPAAEGKKAEGKNDNNDNTEPNGMKSESEKIMGFTSLLYRSS